MKQKPNISLTKLPPNLKHLVHQVSALFGNVIKAELGSVAFNRIELIRKNMTQLRGRPTSESFDSLNNTYNKMRTLSSEDLHAIAVSFTLLLELMNVCENAYRSFRLDTKPKKKNLNSIKTTAKSLTYVLTAHPTEARSPQNIAVLQQIQKILMTHFESNANELTLDEVTALNHLLKVAWLTSIVRDRKPKVKDEADHIYSTLFRDDVLFSILDLNEQQIPIRIRSWVGGDKDGHPGVNEIVMLESLGSSRAKVLHTVQKLLGEIKITLSYFPSVKLAKQLSAMVKQLNKLKRISTGDAKQIIRFRAITGEFTQNYYDTVGESHPSLVRLRQVFDLFPALLVPLELRESSDVLMQKTEKISSLPIDKMLRTVQRISKGGHPKWYARSFIISMTEKPEHLEAAARKQVNAFGDVLLPVVPLFEEAKSLSQSDKIIEHVLKIKLFTSAIKKHWNNQVEMMVGYSDSSKEIGVLASRLAIAEALPRLEKVILKNKMIPIFFHGSGGSIDRGGGSVQDQTAWWPKSALQNYKVTIQGEMVERSLSSPAIAQGQIQHIVESVQSGLKKLKPFKPNKTLDRFAMAITKHYREKITDPDFLFCVQKVTPYSYLNLLKIGSRPAKRNRELQVSGLRAIPWILCWTQTRVLFPTWWGAGAAWTEMSASQKIEIKKAFTSQPVFKSYIKALGFTLAKIDLSIWQTYVNHSQIPQDQKDKLVIEFRDEFKKAQKFYFEVTGHQQLMWFKPWLGESISLRSPMIHPLNVLQILAEERHDADLLRITVTGISSGMMTTG